MDRTRFHWHPGNHAMHPEQADVSELCRFLKNQPLYIFSIPERLSNDCFDVGALLPGTGPPVEFCHDVEIPRCVHG